MSEEKRINWTPDEDERNLHKQISPYAGEISAYDDGYEAYSAIAQGKPIHGLISYLSARSPIQIDAVTHAGTMKSEDGVIIMIDEEAIQKLSDQTKIVFVVLLDEVTKQLPHGQNITAEAINKGRVVLLPLAEYMRRRGTKDIKEARKQLNEAIRALYAVSLEWDEMEYSKPEGKTRKTKTTVNHRMRITDHTITEDEGNPIRRGVAEFRFSFDMAEYLSNGYIMPYHRALLRINTNNNPYSFSFGWKLCCLHNMNYGKSTSETTTVKTLLLSAKNLPRYNDLRNRGNIFDRLIRPFDRDLHALVDIGVLSQYWYISPDGTRIEREQLGSLSYEEFSALSVHYVMKNYPDQTPRLEAKSRRIKAAISRAKTNARKKKTTDGDGGQ